MKTELIWKLALGSAIAWEGARLFGSEYPYLAPISVILCTQATLNKAFRLSLHRIIGTIIGIFVTVLIASHIKINGGYLGLLILIGGYLAKWLKLDRMVIHQVALTILFVFAFEHKMKDYPLERMKDTIIGVMVAIIIQFIWSKFFSRNKPNAG
ncbi:aromatic acid exporter family protein [Bacillus sp. S/N-304-OC-R1]|uniref:FUSC family protein n=1 Tax=Bacillus sp. S/N-304-OC-R1 TaxID=2758034 RepID=UPI001C8D8A0D|nr:FUSC family protein [Bacillus sp. S/N-304-OC-R1]MBY0121781.1 FUSC family protein [Bacillus sp. S/N-304-OC-R1]